MERIKELLEHPELMSNPQRKLFEENQDLIEGKLGNIEPLQVRFHHFEHFALIANNYLSVMGKGPWQYDGKEFLNVACNISQSFAESQTKGYQEYLDFPPHLVDKDDRRRVVEIVGDNSQETEAYTLSTQLYTINFFLRANKNPKEKVTLNKKTDLVCLSCKGGHLGVAKHCSQFVRPKDSMDIKTKKALEIIKAHPFQYFKHVDIVKEQDGFSVPIKSFFDNPFTVEVYNWLRRLT